MAGAIGDVSADALEARLAGLTVTISADDRDPCTGLIARTLGSLLGRMYPNIRVDMQGELAEAVRAEVLAVNPNCDVDGGSEDCVTINVGGMGDTSDVAVVAERWNVILDGARTATRAASGSAALAAAALGAAEVFRAVFANELGRHGRRSPRPTTVNLVTLADPIELDEAHVDIGPIDIAGAGAIGQAALLTLRESNLSADVRVVDPEPLDGSNLQRYILSRVGDEGTPKVDIARERATRNGLTVSGDDTPWSCRHGLVAHRVLCGLDSADARRGVQASLPASVFNAYTGLDDVGWSRHERFGEAPCLACLYWPASAGRTYAEEVGSALGLDPKRVVGYDITRTPVDQPLDPARLTSGFDLAQIVQWSGTSILDDLAAAAERDRSSLDEFAGLTVDELYRHGVCGGALLDITGGRPAVVPLAHESLMAGVLLATQLIVAASPGLRPFRPEKVEGRWNLRVSPSAYHLRQPVRRKACICSDRDFTDAYAARWG